MELQRDYEEVRRLIAQERYDQAEAVLQSISQQSACAEWNYWMAIINLKRGWLENARTYAQRAHHAQPENEQYQMLYQSLTSAHQDSHMQTGKSGAGKTSGMWQCLDCCRCCHDWIECAECIGAGR